MVCSYSEEIIKETIAFHGHSCPGLAIGIRVAEYVKNEFKETRKADLVCVSETDMCGVDAIQYLTGCTYGKGNLIHRDYGKMAFSFYDRQQKRGVRLVLLPHGRGEDQKEMAELVGKKGAGTLSDKEGQKLAELRLMMKNRLMSLPLSELFSVEKLQYQPPRPPSILESLVCEDCGEQTMESRTRRFAGNTLCIPCYQKVEQKM